MGLMRQMALGLFPTLERNLKRMSASRISRNGAIVFLVAGNLFAIAAIPLFLIAILGSARREWSVECSRDASLWGYLAIPLLAISGYPQILSLFLKS